jgi:ZIP family zinc transporter
MTALGAAAVFLNREIDRRVLDWMLGFAGGVMIAASFWSLLLPSIEMSSGSGLPDWIPAAAGFLAGGLVLRGIGMTLPHLYPEWPSGDSEWPTTSWRRSTLLILAVTIHNIPEGLAVGVAFGALAAGHETASLAAAFALALGIGIQNFPEGMAVSLPLRGEGFTQMKSFWYGQLSGVVEPIAALFGAVAVIFAAPILPYALAFAAGAMIFVVVQDVVPESQMHGNADLATMGAMVGFVVMMVLDVGLG